MPEICPTIRVETLLLATDGSEFSEGAIVGSIKLARLCSNRFAAISVIETNPELETIAPQITEKAEKSAREHLESIQKRAKKEGVECNIIIRAGEDSYRYIVDEAAKNNISMIIMGRRGRSGLKRLMMGSVTSRVIGLAPCNVLVVPEAARVEFKSIVVATDGSKYSLAAASEAIGLAKQNKSELTAISVVPSELMTPTDIDLTVTNKELISDKEMHEAEKNVRAVKEAALKEAVAVKAFVMSGRSADAIIEIARDKNADLIVLGSHGRTGLEKLLMGSVAERVIVLSSCAVLVVKAK